MNVKPSVRVYFTDFWEGFLINENFILNILNRKYRVDIGDVDPQIVFFSHFGKDYLKYNKSILVFFSGENKRLDWTSFDFAISSHYINDSQFFRLPLYRVYLSYRPHFIKKLEFDSIEEKYIKWINKPKFCCIVVSNPDCEIRNHFFKSLSRFQHIDSGGRFLNNLGGPVADKLDFINDFKFVISFENSRANGYTTEKILEPLLMGSIPIYWGNPLIENDIKANRYVVYNEGDDIEVIYNTLKKIEINEALAKNFLRGNILSNNTILDISKDKELLQFMDKIVLRSQKRLGLILLAKRKIHRIQLFLKRIQRKINYIFEN